MSRADWFVGSPEGGALAPGRRIASAMVLALILAAAACGDDDGPAVTPAPEPEAQPEGQPEPEPECGDGQCEEGEEGSCPQDCQEPACPDGQAACLDEFGLQDNSLCGPGTTCMEGCCVARFSCTEDAQCAARAGTDVNCQDAQLDCVCNEDTGACFIQMCSANVDCGDGVCANGACKETPASEGLRARIVFAPRLIAQGERQEIALVAIDPETQAVVEGVEIALVSDDSGAVAVVDAATSDGVAAVEGGAQGGVATLTAKVVANANDPGHSATIRGLLAPPEQGVRVTVINESTGAPIEGATVIVHGEGSLRGQTDALGQVILEEASAPLSLTVTAAEHSHVSIIDVNSADLLVPLPQRVSTKIDLDENERALVFDGLRNVDVVQGQPSFRRVLNTGEIEIALSGFGLGSGLLDLNFDLIVGPNVAQYLPPNTGLPLPTNDPIEIPGGVTLLFNRQPVVDRFLLVSPPGVRTLWTLGGRVSLIENPNLVADILGSINGNIDIGQIVAAILPFFANFYSGFTPDVVMADSPELPPRSIEAALKVPTGLRTGITAPALPTLGETPIDGVLFLGGVLTPDQGFLPMGITAALDASGDALPDGRVDPVTLQMSPAHSGVQGPHARYVVVVVALSFNRAGGGGREATSVLMASAAPGAALPSASQLGRDGFLGFSAESAFDPEARRLTLSPGDADIVRTVIEGEDGLKWIVWSPGSTEAVDLPDLAALDIEDPTTRDRVRVELLDTADGAEDLDDLAALRGKGLNDIIGLIDAFSIVELE